MIDTRRRFALLETLGKGGFGTVYRAEVQGQVGFAKQVALKVLNHDGKHPPDAMEELAHRLRDEARMLGLIDHRAVVQVDSLTELETGWAVVMEYVHGVDASILVKASVPPTVALAIVEEVASALHAAYAKPSRITGGPLHLIHRDIKPANIRITPEGTVKVLDFGVARADFGAREARTSEMRFGSLRYMAPERLENIETHAADVFGLGLTLAELLAGRRFREPPKTASTYGAFVHGLRELVRENLGRGPWAIREPSTIEALVDLVVECVQFDHTQRPTARYVEQRCRSLARGLEGPALRDWTEQRIPELLAQRPIEPVDTTDTILVESRSPGDLSHTQTRSRTLVRTVPIIGALATVALGIGAIGLVFVGALATGVVSIPTRDELVPAWVGTPGTAVAEAQRSPASEPLDQEAPSAPSAAEEAVADAPEAPEPAAVGRADRGRASPDDATIGDGDGGVRDDGGDGSEGLSEPDATPAPSKVTRPAPEPVAAPTPRPPAAPRVVKALVTIEGNVERVELDRDGQTVPIGRSRRVVPGDYVVRATFPGREPVVAAQITIEPGESVTLQCKPAFQKCVKR